MNKKNKYLETFEVELGPEDEVYVIGVTQFIHRRPTFSWHAQSDLDFYGYTEIEYDVLNKDMTPATEIEKSMTAREKEYVWDMISEEMMEEM